MRDKLLSDKLGGWLTQATDIAFGGIVFRSSIL